MPWAGSHLNVAPPIWQRFPGEVEETAPREFTREDFLQLLFSGSPQEREYAEALRGAYNDLYNSPDKRLRQYYFDNQKQASPWVSKQGKKRNLQLTSASLIRALKEKPLRPAGVFMPD